MYYNEETRDIKKYLCDNIREVRDDMKQKGVTDGNIRRAKEIFETIKDILKVDMLMSDEYSQDGGNWEARGTYGHGNSYSDGGYDDDMSVRRGRRGGNSRDGGMMSMRNNRRYSRDDGRDYMKEQIREMMNSADDESARDVLRRAMKQLDEV